MSNAVLGEELAQQVPSINDDILALFIVTGGENVRFLTTFEEIRYRNEIIF